MQAFHHRGCIGSSITYRAVPRVCPRVFLSIRITPCPAEIAGAVQGNNGWGLPAYRGPAPPLGSVHNYHFAVFALDEELNLPPGLDRRELLLAIEGHVIGQGDMVTLYERQPMNEFPR